MNGDDGKGEPTANGEPSLRAIESTEESDATRGFWLEPAVTEEAHVKRRLQSERAKRVKIEQQLARQREKLARSHLELDRQRDKQDRTRAELERGAEENRRLQEELATLHRSYHLSGVAKKLDLRELDGFGEIAGAVIAEGRTGMDYDRLFSLWQAVADAPPDAPVVEIGSYRGGSARFIAEALSAHSRTPRLYVCDTFAGHARTDATVDVAHHETGKFIDTSAEEVATYLEAYPGLEMVVGDIAETRARLPDEPFGLVHLDVDVFPTTALCLRYFAPRLAEGALMVIDDYGFVTCPGVKRAADEFVSEFPEYRLWHLLTGQALLSRRPGSRPLSRG